jgi:hypothetical protein
METIDLDTSTHELIRRQGLAGAVTDLRRAADSLEKLSEIKWPALDRDVDEARATVAQVRESLSALDQIGWPSGND